MHVSLKQTLDCSPDEAWELIRSPKGFVFASAPVLTFTPLEPAGFPDRWQDGVAHRAAAKLFGIVPLGTVLIDTTRSVRKGARMVTDLGGPVDGVLGGIEHWRHRMAVSPAPDGRTVFRDRVEFGGPLAPLAWAGVFVFWQWRARRIRELARRWAG